MVLVGDEAQAEARFGPFGGGANLAQDRCMVYAKCTVGSEIVLDAPMVLLGDVGHVESFFGLLGASVGAR